MSAIDDIAGKLIEAAYERFGRPPDPGGIYIADVVRDTDVPGYFRVMAALAKEPRSMELWHRYRDSVAGHDAEMVMEAGLKHLAKGDLPPEQRRIIEEIAAIKAWWLKVRHELDLQLQNEIEEEIERENRAANSARDSS